MKLGFVGCGSHAEKLARVLTELGAAIVCHDRASSTPGPEWAGARMPWRDMLTAGLDGIVAVATPQVTTEAVREWFRGKRWPHPRLLATKPLLLDGAPDCYVSANLHVDLWRIWSPSWRAFRDDLRGKRIDSVNVVCVGNGPIREFSGVLDYGPHAMALVGDLLGEVPARWEKYGANSPDMFKACALFGDTIVKVTTGNSAVLPETCVVVMSEGKRHEWREDGVAQGYAANDRELARNHRDVALRAFCRSFLNGEPNDSFRLSTAGYRVLKEFDV